MKKISSFIVPVLLLFGFTFTPSVFAAEETTNTLVPTEVTEYNLVPEGFEKASQEEITNAGFSGGSATVTCKDIGHSIADCDTVYKLVNDKITTVNTTVTINDPKGGHILEGESDFRIINPSKSTVYSSVSFILPPGTYYSELWGKVQGNEGVYTVTNVKSRNFKMTSR